MTEQELRQVVDSIGCLDEEAMEAARQRQASLAKPPGSLGILEDISVRMAGVTGQENLCGSHVCGQRRCGRKCGFCASKRHAGTDH